MQVVVDKCVKNVYGSNAESRVRFEFVEADEVKPLEYLELAQKARDLGLKVDVQKLRDLTGLTFIAEEEKDLWTPSLTEAEDKA